MKKPISIIQFKLKEDGKVFKFKTKETYIIFICLLILWFEFIPLSWFFFIPIFLFICLLVVFFRPNPKFGITSEMLEKAKGDGLFQYEHDGFIIELPNIGETKIKWSDIKQIISYRNGGMYNEDFGIYVFIDNNLHFTVPEMSNGCFKFYTKIKENLKLIDNFWLVNISDGNDRQIIYERGFKKNIINKLPPER